MFATRRTIPTVLKKNWFLINTYKGQAKFSEISDSADRFEHCCMCIHRLANVLVVPGNAQRTSAQERVRYMVIHTTPHLMGNDTSSKATVNTFSLKIRAVGTTLEIFPCLQKMCCVEAQVRFDPAGGVVSNFCWLFVVRQLK